MARATNMADLWKNGMEMSLMAAEAQAIIAMRLWGMSGLWSVTGGENDRMVSEKTQAMTKAMIGAGSAAMTGQRPDQVMAAAIKPLRQTTRANRKRLAKRGPKLG